MNEPIFKSALNLMINGGITAVLGFLFIVVITQLFPPSDVGYYSAIISAAGLLALLSRFGFDIGLIRFLPGSKDPNGLISSCQSVSLIGAVVLSVVFISGVTIWSPSLEFIAHNIAYVAMFIGLTAITSVLYIQHNYYIVKGLTKHLIFRDIVRDIIKIGAVVVFISFGLTAIIGAYLLGLIVSFILATLLLMRNVPGFRPGFTIKRSIVRDLTRYSANNYIAGMVGSAPFLILPIVVVNILGAEQGAYFFVAWSIATIIFLAIDAISTSFFAAGAQSPDEAKGIALKSMKMAYLILIPTITCTVLFANSILRVFGEPYAENSTGLLILLSVCTIPMAFNEIYANMKRITMEMKPLFLFNLTLAIGILGFGVFFMSFMGLIGVGVGFLVSQVILTVIIARSWKPWSTS